LDILGLGRNGWEILQDLKSDPRTAGIPVVIVSVVDEPNQGIALHAADYVIKPLTKPRVLQALRRHVPPQGHKGRTVLVVDDDVRHLEMAAEILGSAGYGVLQSSGGREALDTLGTTRPDAIVLDLMMPEIDGFQLLDRIKQQPALDKIPVLVLTAKDLTDSDVERLSSRVEALCRKGLSREELLTHIEHLTGAAAVENAAVVEHVQNRRS
jgi:CheY-like chemotaxis protein